MKWIFVFSLLFLAVCADQTTSKTSEVSAIQDHPVNQSTNNSPAAIPEPDNRVRFMELEIQNEKFETVPDNFKNVDFKNLSYSTDFPKKSITLKDGEFEYNLKDEKTGGLSAGWASLHKIYFVDLTGDNIKEAIVFLKRGDCGVSCDGGSYAFYIFQTKQQKPKLLWYLESGGLAYECGLKNFTIQEKKISFEVYADCIDKKQVLEAQRNFSRGKQTSVGFTKFEFKFDGKKFVLENRQFTETEKISHRLFQTEISINN